MRKQDIHFQELGFVKRDKDLCFQRPGEWSTWALSPRCKSNDKEERTMMHLVCLHTGKRHLPGEGTARNGEDEPVKRLLDTKKMTSLGPLPWPPSVCRAPKAQGATLSSHLELEAQTALPMTLWPPEPQESRILESPQEEGVCMPEGCVCVCVLARACEGGGPRKFYLILGQTLFQTRSDWVLLSWQDSFFLLPGRNRGLRMTLTCMKIKSPNSLMTVWFFFIHWFPQRRFLRLPFAPEL